MAEAAEMIVERSRQKPRIGHRHIMIGRANGAPLQILQVKYAFAIKEVGERSLLAARFVRSMKLDVQLVPGRRIEDAFTVIHCVLAVAVEKVDHQAANARD